MAEREKLCLWCVHFLLDVGSPGYSEYTPGSDFSMDCRKRHWEYSGPSETEEKYRACLVSAEICPDYKFDVKLEEITPAYRKRARG